MPIPHAAFERILHQAVIRPAGRQFRGEPARQVEILRYLRESPGPVAFDALHEHLRKQGVVRSERSDPASRRKAIAQAVEAINIKLATFFFLARDVRLIEEMFRIRVIAEETGNPSYEIQDFFEVRKVSGVSFYSTTAEPAGGLTREMYELVTEIRPHRMDLMAPSFSSFFGNPEFRSLLIRNLDLDDARVRLLLLDPESQAAARLEAHERGESPLLGGLRDRIRVTLRHAADITAALPPPARRRFKVKLTASAPLWRFRMIFLPDMLHLRLSAPSATGQTLIKLGNGSALYTSLHDVFQQEWLGASDPA